LRQDGLGQLASNDYLKGTSGGANLKDNAWLKALRPAMRRDHGGRLFEHGETRPIRGIDRARRNDRLL